MCSATICPTEPSSGKPDGPVSETRGSRISRALNESSEMMTANTDDWRTLLVHYLENPGHTVDRIVQRHALKYVIAWWYSLSLNYRWFVVKMLGFGSI
jgi:hypothetical protein